MRARAALVGSVACVACVVGAASPARSDMRLDAAFVDSLTPPNGRRHPFADTSGKLAVTVEIPLLADARQMGLLPLARGLATVRLSPGELARFEANHPDLRFSIWPSLHPVLDESAQLNGTIAYRDALRKAGSAVAGTGKGVVVGIVDSGLDVTHADFRDALGHTRVAWLIDFSHPPIARHPELETQFGCNDAMQTPCAVLDAADIDLALGGGGAYVPRDLLGHGTHVASIAAGNGGPAARFVGGAPEATLVIANVSQGATGDSTDSDIAMGMSFVFDRAAALGLPAVGNLSLGSDFGPHDGTTPLEKALGEMVGPAHPGRAIVVAAGNSGALYVGTQAGQRLGVHTQTRVTGGVEAKTSLVPVADVTTGKLSGSVSVWLTFGPTDDVAVGFDGPGLSIPPVKLGTKASASTPDNALRAAIYNGVVEPDISLTADSRGAIVVWDGSWPADADVALRFEGEGFVDAWVEAHPDGTTGAFSEFFGLATREGTVNVPATGTDLISVGCTVNRTAWTDADLHLHDVTMPATLRSRDNSLLAPADSTCFFSSIGPTARGAIKPEISAPGGIVVAAMSADAVPGHPSGSIFDAPSGVCPDDNACLVVDPGHAILSGSSMSAPQVAGAAALLLERDATLTQGDVLLLLEQGARRPSGNIGADYQLGVGALAVGGAISALEARTAPIVREPDASESWMSLSAGTARPDLGWAVRGTVELRGADGSIADGFDEARLSLVTSSEGIVLQPLERAAPGLFRFEVGALSGTGSRAMDIDVRLDGIPIGESGSRLSGHRALPIGADRWIATGSARAYGGCSVSTASKRSVPVWTLAVLTLATLIRRKRQISR